MTKQSPIRRYIHWIEERGIYTHAEDLVCALPCRGLRGRKEATKYRLLPTKGGGAARLHNNKDWWLRRGRRRR